MTMSKTLKPGTPAPKSGQYQNPGTGNEVTGVKGKPLAADAAAGPRLQAGGPHQAQALSLGRVQVRQKAIDKNFKETP
jgi:hypothetical protein